MTRNDTFGRGRGRAEPDRKGSKREQKTKKGKGEKEKRDERAKEAKKKRGKESTKEEWIVKVRRIQQFFMYISLFLRPPPQLKA